MKTVRFATVVAAAGQPSTYLMWLPPEQDKVLQRALREQRLMTVHQDVRGTRRDYGTVGLAREPEAQFLVFPRTLEAFAGARIIGIDYAALSQDAQMPGTELLSPERRKRTERPKPPRTRPKAPPPARPTPSSAAPPPPRAPARAPEPPAPPPLSHAAILRTVETAIRELKAGKAVAAHERLVKLAADLKASRAE